jgi:hypothetical protein
MSFISGNLDSELTNHSPCHAIMIISAYEALISVKCTNDVKKLVICIVYRKIEFVRHLSVYLR